MPTLDLLTPRPPALADAFHDVRAPGGYEWWYFDAEDRATDTQIVAIFLHGFVFHPAYLRRYARYLNRPTLFMPPVPADFPCMYFVVYRHGKIVSQFMTQYAAKEFSASFDRPRVDIGPNTFTTDLEADEAACDSLALEKQGIPAPALHLALEGTPWKLTGRGPKTLTDQQLKATFSFHPRLAHVADERRFFSRAMTGADHHWVVANPLCDVTGSIRLKSAASTETIEFNGRGYHDHNYGTAPIGPGLKRWIWGRAFFGDDAAPRVVTFHFARPRDASLPDELHLTEASPAEWKNHTPAGTEIEVDWSARTALLLAYPQRLQFGDVLTLSSPRLIDNQPFYLRIVYDAQSRGQTSTAFCEVAYPHRLRWPVLGRMIELSIDRRDRKS